MILNKIISNYFLIKSKGWFSLMLHGFLSFGLLFLGGSIYLLFRSKSILMFVWVDKLGLTPVVDKIRSELSHVSLSPISIYEPPLKSGVF